MRIPSKELWDRFKQTHGAFSTCEALALYNICLQAPAGNYLELGVHKGKSATIAGAALKSGCFTLVDPIFSDTKIAADVFFNVRNAAGFDKTFVIGLIADFSTNVIPKFGELSYVFVDSGDHGQELVDEEVKLLEDRVVSGGILAFHDFGNQFTAVARGYDYLLSTGKYEVVPIDWGAIFEYVKENNLEDKNVSWHLYPELPHPPNFVGALRKV